jgi:hypothetical protein
VNDDWIFGGAPDGDRICECWCPTCKRVALALEEAGAKHIDFFCAANQARISALEVALRASEAEVESKDQTIMRLSSEKATLDEANKDLGRALESMKQERDAEKERARGYRLSLENAEREIESARQEGARIEGENLRAVLKRSKELRNLGFNEALAPKRGRDSTGVTAAEYARAADEVEQAIDAALRGGSPQSSHTPECHVHCDTKLAAHNCQNDCTCPATPPEPPTEPRSLHDGKDYDAYDINTGKKK